MTKISGFTFIHNGVEAGYPFVEAIEAVRPSVDEMVVLDMASTDDTRLVLEALRDQGTITKIAISDEWVSGLAGEQLRRAHSTHQYHCEHDVIWHFEADEVFDRNLARNIRTLLRDAWVASNPLSGTVGIAVWRLQVEQNFQRCRWYPELVHRVFRKGTVVKQGHSTVEHLIDLPVVVIPMEVGLLWDVTNCFRDNWVRRCQNQAELWGEHPVEYRWTEYHANLGYRRTTDIQDVKNLLDQPHWLWKASPFRLPESLDKLVGVTDYRHSLGARGLL